MPLTIPTSADIRTALFHILRNDGGVIAWATLHGFDLGGTRFREWQPFAPFLDFGVLIAVDPVSESSPGESCRSAFYNVTFTLYVQSAAAGSTLVSEWLGVLESALDDTEIHTDGVSGQAIFIRDIEFVNRGPQIRHEEGWELLTNFSCGVSYA